MFFFVLIMLCYIGNLDEAKPPRALVDNSMPGGMSYHNEGTNKTVDKVSTLFS